MRASAIISSSLLFIAVSGAPIDLPKLPVDLPSLGLPSLPSPPQDAPDRQPAFSTTLPTAQPTGTPATPKQPTNELGLPIEDLPVKRAELPLVDGLLKEINVPALPELPVDELKRPIKRAELPVVNGLIEDVQVPKIPVSTINSPVRRADVPVAGDVLKDVSVINGVDPKINLPLPINTLPVGTVLNKKAVDLAVNLPVDASIDHLIEDSTSHIPAVAAPKVGVISRDIKQSVPVVDSVNVPLDAGDVQVGTADKYVEGVVKGTTVGSLPKVAREINQSLPVAGGVSVPLDAGRVQVGTVDTYVDEVVKGTTIDDIPVEQVVKGTTIKDLPNVGPRQDKQSLPVVGSVNVPVDLGSIQLGNVNEHVGGVVKGITADV